MPILRATLNIFAKCSMGYFIPGATFIPESRVWTAPYVVLILVAESCEQDIYQEIQKVIVKENTV